MSSKTTTKVTSQADQPIIVSRAKNIAAICGIASPMQTGFSVQGHILASSNNPDILDQLRCPLCLVIKNRPLELPCRALVCTDCMVRWLMASNCSGVTCPCCIMDTPFQMRPAPPLIQTLLMDIVVQCLTCGKNVQTGEYRIHTCFL
eukprot:Em0009g1056a